MKSQQRYFDNIDPNLTDSDLSQELKSRCGDMIYDWDALFTADRVPDGCIEPHPADEAVIRSYLESKSDEIRATAIDILFQVMTPPWPDVKQWVLDPSEQVRKEALLWLEFMHCDNPDWTMDDTTRAVNLVEHVIEQYPDHASVSCLWGMATTNEEDYWLDLTWEAAERLVDSGNETAVDYLTTCYFWSIIPDLPLLADDPRIIRWVESNDARRREILDYVVTMAGTRVEELSRTAILLFERNGSEDYRELALKQREIRRKSYLPDV